MRPELSSLYYRGQTIKLDGYTFNACRFDHCTLTCDTANFELVHCIIDSSCTLQFGVGAGKIIRLFLSRYPQFDSMIPSFFKHAVHPDGTISISERVA